MWRDMLLGADEIRIFIDDQTHRLMGQFSMLAILKEIPRIACLGIFIFFLRHESSQGFLYQ